MAIQAVEKTSWERTPLGPETEKICIHLNTKNQNTVINVQDYFSLFSTSRMEMWAISINLPASYDLKSYFWIYFSQKKTYIFQSKIRLWDCLILQPIIWKVGTQIKMRSLRILKAIEVGHREPYLWFRESFSNKGILVNEL